MASEDSRNRDGFRRFIVDAMDAMCSIPSIVRWRFSNIIVTTEENFEKSSRLAVLSGFTLKNGVMRPDSSPIDLTLNLYRSSR